jgi:hypothetical protein
LPGRRLLKAGQHTQQRRFAAAGCAQQREDFTFINREVDVIDGVLPVERLRQITDFQQRGQRFGVFACGRGIASFTQVLSGKKLPPYGPVAIH